MTQSEQIHPLTALLNYRATPHSTTGVSPSEALKGRKPRTGIPALMTKTTDRIQLRTKDNEMKTRYKTDYDSRYGAKPLPALNADTPVLIKLGSESHAKSKAHRYAVNIVVNRMNE
jgi:hypothetical protein